MLPPKVIMKPDTNLSRCSSIFYCNRHQIDRTSMINFCATTQKHLGNFEEKNRWLYFSNGPSGPAGGTETIKKGSPYLYMFQKWGKRHDTSFITSILKSLAILVIWLALIGAIYLQKAPSFSLNCIFLPANEIEKRLLQPFEDQLTTGSKKHFYRLKCPVSEGLNFAISKWM